MAVRRARPTGRVHPTAVRLPPVAARTRHGWGERGRRAAGRGLAVQRYAARFHRRPYALCRGKAGFSPPLLATVAGWVGAGGSLSPRPQVFGFILLAVSLAAWLRTERDGRIRWWLLPLTWLWACVHGTWLYAVGLTGCSASACCWTERSGGPRSRIGVRRGPRGGRDAHASRTSTPSCAVGDLADQPVHQRVETYARSPTRRPQRRCSWDWSSWSRGCGAKNE